MTATSFRITGLPVEPFVPLFGRSDDALARDHVRRYVVDGPGFPDRVELREAQPGETVLLLNHAHLPDAGPYRASHAIFVVEGARHRYDAVDRVPDVLRPRMLSLRAFDADGLMHDADLVDGGAVEGLVARLFADPAVVFIHAHYAKRGCYACRIDRVGDGADGAASHGAR